MVFCQRGLVEVCYLFLNYHALPAVHGSSRINNMLKQAHFVETGANEVKVGSCDGAWNTEHNSTTFDTILPISIE